MWQILKTASILTIFAILGGGLVAFSYQSTIEQIKINEREALLRTLTALVPKNTYDNDLFTDTKEIESELGVDNNLTIHLARKAGQPVAAILIPTAPDGYNGRINMLVAVNYAGILLGVRVTSHQETPGLGDKIDLRKSNWIRGFKGYSLLNPTDNGWKVKRDGGIFDQFTGATITPRAVVKTVHKTLSFYWKFRDKIFEPK
ncbi:electron transport complex subunit RsxG [Candidatus Halobeggiatoa sp. HSG11]|nr:electron transport complex subunit RsxG [Candidatus Halobeggiatoa sp. HSG11]